MEDDEYRELVTSIILGLIVVGTLIYLGVYSLRL